PDEIRRAKDSGFIHAVKYYPAGATTNSDAGVTELTKCYKTLEVLQQLGMPFLVHGEVTDPTVDIFDREAVFIERVLQPLRQALPQLKVVFEHITTADAAQYHHDGLTELLVVETMHIRKQMLYDKCDAAIILPGGFGTMDEVFEMLTWNQLEIHNKKIFFLNSGNFYDHLIAHIEVMQSESLLYGPAEKITVLKEPIELLKYLS
ncbi:MAG: LOG family protein, partial [Ferruginibacter sp.]